MNYNLFTSVSNIQLNSFIKQVYNKIYPDLFNKTFNINKFKIATVEIDIQSSPIINSTHNKIVLEEHVQYIIDNELCSYREVLSHDNKHLFVDYLSGKTLELLSSSVLFTINHTNGEVKKYQGSLSIIIQIKPSIQGSNEIGFIISSTKFAIEDNPICSIGLSILIDIYNKCFTNNILSEIRIPQLSFDSIKISQPTPLIEDGGIVVYSNINSVISPIHPSPSQLYFPRNSASICLTAQSLVDVFDDVIGLPKGPMKQFDWEIISGQCGAQISKPTNLSINSDGSITMDIEAEALAQLSVDTHIPCVGRVGFGPKAFASIKVTLKPEISNGKLFMACPKFPIPYFDFSWGIPEVAKIILDPLLEGLKIALNKIIAPIISDLFSIPSLYILTLPNISFIINNQDFKININESTTEKFESFLAINNQISIS